MSYSKHMKLRSLDDFSIYVGPSMTRAFPRLIAVFLLALCLSACAVEDGSDAGTQGDPSIPTTPNGLSALVVSSTQINLTWNAATDDVAVLGYYVYRNGDATIAVSTSTNASGLSPDTQYCFSVAAFDGDGKVSPQSSSVCATSDPLAPSAWTTVRSGAANELSNVVWDGNGLVVIEETFGSSTAVHTSPDGLDWSDYPTTGFGFNGAKDMIQGNNQFVAIDSWPFVSPDGIAWELIADFNFEGQALAWSPSLSLYVAVGDAGYISTSTDGRTWTTVDPAPTVDDIFGVAWLNGRFYAAGAAQGILTSIDGTTWVNATTPGAPLALESIAWNGQTGTGAVYVATGYSTVLVSSDGDTWTEAAVPPLGFNDSVAWGGGLANCFVTVGSDNHIFSSSDGQTWTRRFLSASPVIGQLSLNEVTWTGMRFVAVGEKGMILASEDGIDWSIVASGADLNGLAHDGSRFIAVGDHGRLAVASDPSTWEYRHTGDDAHYLYDLVWDGSRYVSVGQTYSLYSNDLSLWQAAWEGATSSDTAIIWDGSQFVRTGDGIMTWDGVTTYAGSSDPKWEWSYFTATEWFNDLIWDGSTYLAVGNGGAIYSSPDATNGSWVSQVNPDASNLEAITQDAGRFIAVGADGTILTSDDSGVTWAPRSSGTNATIYDVTWTGSQFVAVGHLGMILTSPDGSTWTAADHGNSTLYSVLSSGTDTVIVGASGTIIKNN